MNTFRLLTTLTLILVLAGTTQAQYPVDQYTQGLWHFEEGSGDTAFDATNNQYDLTLRNGADWIPDGYIGGAIDMSAPAAQLVSADTPGNGWDAITIDAMIYITNQSGDTDGYNIMSRADWYNTDESFHFRVRHDMGLQANIWFNEQGGEESEVISAPNEVQMNTWHHVRMTWEDGQPIRLYVDELEVGTGNEAIYGIVRAGSDSLQIGCHRADQYGWDYYDGYFDEVRLSNVVRTDGAPPMEDLGFTADFWLHRRTNTYSIFSMSYADGAYSRTNFGVRYYINQNNSTGNWEFRLYDFDSDLLALAVINYPGDRWIHCTMERTPEGEITAVWDADVNPVTLTAVDDMGIVDNPFIAVHPSGYYNVTGGFYFDDATFTYNDGNQQVTVAEDFEDGNWNETPRWIPYRNEDQVFEVNSEEAHSGNYALEAWQGANGDYSDHTTLYLPLSEQSIEMTAFATGNTTIPATGGYLPWRIRIVNTTDDAIQLDGWTEAIPPGWNYNGPTFGPIELVQDFNAPANGLIVYNLTQPVPGTVPAGLYTYIVKLGDYPNTPIARYEFYFTKLGASVATAEPYLNFPAGSWSAPTLVSVESSDPEVNYTTVSTDSNRPTSFRMSAAYPNPFNPATTVNVFLPNAANLKVSAFNVAGQQVATLANDRFASGEHALTFDASNLTSGLYFIRATVPGHLDQVQKVMLVR
ncbi:T9SS type A sorting domain-containing protein [bacterium]|nr:T9SS type A sorting domain-containing protein [bacterium]